MEVSVGRVTWLSSGEVVAQGVVEDLFVVGNQGFVRFRITHTTVPGVVVGHYIYIGFEDNGEGSGAPPDRHTYICQSVRQRLVLSLWPRRPHLPWPGWAMRYIELAVGTALLRTDPQVGHDADWIEDFWFGCMVPKGLASKIQPRR